jgi:alkylhydroperoxidase family enzyme
MERRAVNVPNPPRIAPLPEAERTPRQREVVDDLVVGPTVNIYTTLVRHPDAAAAMVNFGRTLRAGRLSPRHRELLILRTGWNCGCEYEFAQHRRAALAAGMTLDEARDVQRGPGAEGWTDEIDVALLRAADELHATTTIGEATWASLAARFGEQELLEIISLVGYYHLVSFLLNTLGVPLEDGAEGFLAD